MANVSLPMSEIASVEIPIPPIETQRNLIGTFQRLEESKINLTAEFTRQLELLRQLRRAFLLEAMQGKLVEQDFKDEPAYILLGKIKTERERLIAETKIKKGKTISPIRHDEVPFEIPSNWVWCRLDDLRNAEFTLSYGVLVPGNNISDGIPFVRVQDLDAADKNVPPSKSISPEIDSQYVRTKLQGGEILICVVGSIGKVSLVPDAWIGANIARAVCRFMPSKLVSRKLLYYSLNGPYVQEYFQKGYKSIQPTLNVNVLEKTPIPLPPLCEQNRIVEKLDELMASCNELEKSIQQSKTQAEMLLQASLKEALEA
jgi:type I restriction enzyme S subunit